MPVFRRHKVSQRILVGVRRDFGIPGGTAGEQHQHRVVAAGRVLRAREAAGKHAVFLVEIAPALAVTVHHDAVLHGGTVLHGQINLRGDLAHAGRHHALHARGVEAIGQVVLHQLVRGRDRNRAQLVQTQDAEPELIVPAQDQHHAVSLFDAQRLEVVRGAAGIARNLPEAEPTLVSEAIQMQHRQLVRLLLRHLVHNVKGKVEVFGIVERKRRDQTLVVLLRRHEVLIDQLFGLLGGDDGIAHLQLLGFVAGKHHRAEQAVRAVHSDHAVRLGGIVVNAVALVQHLDVLTHLHLQRAGENQVEFLSAVARKMNRPRLLLGYILVSHKIRLGNLSLEQRRERTNFKPRLLRGDLAHALAGDGVACQAGGLALHQVGDFNAKLEGAFMDEREREIRLAFLVQAVHFRRHLGALRHFLLRVPGDFSQLADSSRHLVDFAAGRTERLHDTHPPFA